MKRLISFLLSVIICLSLTAGAFAAPLTTPDGSDSEIIAVKSGESTRAEETTWYFRIKNGILQMRLWSITYGIWLTDWIDVGPVNP